MQTSVIFKLTFYYCIKKMWYYRGYSFALICVIFKK